MATNLEFKAQYQPLESLYPRLSDLKATHRETINQIDTYFYVTQVKDPSILEICKPRLKLREISETGEGWLIYYERPNHNESRYSQYQLSEVTNPSTLKALLTVALGIETIVQKQREVWMFKNTRIHLDTVADLGQFVELETVFQGQTEAEAIDEHQHVKNTLHLGTADPVAVSYSDLVMQKSGSISGTPASQDLGESKMNYSTYQKILEGYEGVDSIKRSKLLRVYLHIPSLPKLRAIRASLAELKRTFKLPNGMCLSNGK